MENIRFVYADNAATTPVSEEVFAAMLPFMKEKYGNPSSAIYSKGREAREALDKARSQVAKAIGANSDEIFFTSGGTEADNWAIKGAARAMGAKGKKHIVSTEFEHHAVLHSLESLESEGFEVTLIKPDSEGIISSDEVAAAIRKDTALVTVIYANNEIGTIQPIPEIGRICRQRGVIFHTDAVQAIGNIEIDVKSQQIDMLALSGHKIKALKGIGALYIRKGIPTIKNLIDGGGQESRRRAGTENVPAIVGLGAAIEIACRDISKKSLSMRAMSNKLMDELLIIPKARLNGHRDKRLPGNVNISFEGIEGEGLLMLLDIKGVCASSGSACTAASLDPSHVLLSIGLPHEIAHGSLRLSITESTTDDDVDYIIDVVSQAVERLREISPLWAEIIKKELK